MNNSRPRPMLAPALLAVLLAASLAPACARTSEARLTELVAHDRSEVAAWVREYCERYPNRCHVPAPCPPIVTDPNTGATTGGCYPVEWVCCGPGGCVAVMLAGDCLGGSDLYWSNCEAGESAIDPVTGLAVVICHD